MSQRGFALPFVILIGLVLLAVAAIVIEYAVFKDVHVNALKKASGQPVKESSTAKSDGGCESNPNPSFSNQFTDLSKILYINPIGNTQAGSTGRSYIIVKEGEEAPIYSPTDATLETIIYARRGGPDTPGEYGLYFRASCEVTYLFDHIDKVSDKIKELAPKEPASTTQTEKGTKPNVVIKKGELLGYSNGTPQASTFDFLLMNKSKPVSHLNPKRWQWEQTLYAQCPYDYFTANDNELKNIYSGMVLVHNDNIIQKKWNKEQGYKLSCGEVSRDIKDTASGGWFKGDSTDIKGDYLSINKYLSTVQVSLRKDGKLQEALTDYSPDILLSDVTPGKTACYQDANQNKWVIVKLMSDNKLSMVKGNGSCPTQFVQEVSDIWER